MKLVDLAMIAADTGRSRVYLQALSQHGLTPGMVLVMRDEKDEVLPGQIARDDSLENMTATTNIIIYKYFNISFNPRITIKETLETFAMPYELFNSKDINSELIVRAVANRPESVFIYSGYGGAILGKDILSTGKKFLHIHGGYLPDYKGSTTNYYSLIDKNECGASAIFLNEKIDCGPIILRKKFPPPPDRTGMDYIYDPIIRARVLIETIQLYLKTGRWEFELENNQGGETFYIMHPVLRHIAILAK